MQPVFDAIARSARCGCSQRRPCSRRPADRRRAAPDRAHANAARSTSRSGSCSRPRSRAEALGKAVLSREPAWISDVESDPDYSSAFRAGRAGTRLAKPACRADASRRRGDRRHRSQAPRAGPFTRPSDRRCCKTFADQAVIAIENVRLFNETKDALERQTATAEILRVIASSPTNVQPVFEAIVESAVRLCGARFGRVYRYDGSVIEMVASHGLGAAGLVQVQAVFPRPAADDTTAGRGHPDEATGLHQGHRAGRDRARAVTPDDGGNRHSQPGDHPPAACGSAHRRIHHGLGRSRAFNAPQVALLQTFADQAVIAIENVRLFNETSEALERQTATAEILRVIAGSPTSTQPVFDAIVEATRRLVAGSRQACSCERARRSPSSATRDPESRIFAGCAQRSARSNARIFRRERFSTRKSFTSPTGKAMTFRIMRERC